MKKKILSLFMVFIMVMGMIPATAFADTEVQLDADALVKVTVNGELQPNTAYVKSGKTRHGFSVSSNEIVLSTVDGSKIEYFKCKKVGDSSSTEYPVDADSMTINLKELATFKLENTSTDVDLHNLFKGYGTYYLSGLQVKLENQSNTFNIYIEYAHDHVWENATCTSGGTCTICGATGYHAGHKLMGDGQCENCESQVPAISVTANGKPVELIYTTQDPQSGTTGNLYMEIYEGSDIQIVKKDGYTYNYTWEQIKRGYPTSENMFGDPAWPSWVDAYALPIKTPVRNMDCITSIRPVTADFFIIGVISHIDHSYVNGECNICGKACEHSWNAETGICSTCSAECAHETYADGVCSVCGMAEPVVDLSLFTFTVNGEAAPVYAGMTNNNKLRHGTTITGTSLTITTKDGSVITQVKDATKNRITGENYLVTNDSSSITIDLSKCSSTDLVTGRYPTEVNFPFGTDTTIYRLNATVNGASQQIYVEVLCDHENWQEAGCSTPKVCLGCGKFASYPAHKLLGDGFCENCETTVPAISVTANGKPVELSYTTAKSGYAYTGVLYMEIYEGSDIQIVKTGDGAYTDNYTWDQIKAKYQTTTRADGSPGWLDWPDSYKLPMKTDVENIVNMPYIQRRTNSAGTTYDFYVISVIAHPDHSYVDGECTICGKEDPAVAALNAAKEAAKTEIESYKDADDYRDAQKAELAAAVEVAKTAIDVAASEAEVTAAVEAAKTAMDAIKTDADLTAEEEAAAAEALAQAKEEAKAEIEGYKDPADYREAEQEVLAGLVEAAKEAIDAATSEEEVAQALEEAKVKLDEVKTDAQLTEEEEAAAAAALAQAKEDAKAEIEGYKNADDYRDAQKAELAAAVEAAKAAIDAAESIEEVEAAAADAKAAMDAIKTDAQLTAEEEADKEDDSNKEDDSDKDNSQPSDKVEDKHTVDIDVDSYEIFSGDVLTVVGNGEFNDFLEVLMDGKVVDSKHYVVKEGSTILTFTSTYLDTLEPGKHTVEMVWKTGRASEEILIVSAEVPAEKEPVDKADTEVPENDSEKESENPNTGDMNQPFFYLAVLFMAGAAAVALRRKED